MSVLESIFGDDKEICRSILAEFVHSADPYMFELSEAFEGKVADGVKSLAHKLKSSSRTIGAEVLGDLCETLESTAPNQNWELIAEQQVAVRAELANVLDYIKSA
jgi:HPt (histidine-containing phosphotransfer) domain-containing protein